MAGLGFVTGIAPRDRVLVVIFLRGGADGLTLVAPVADDAYHRARPTLRVRENEGVRLDDVFALHPRLAALSPLWSSGELLTLAVAGSVFARWWGAEQRAAGRLDRQLAT